MNTNNNQINGLLTQRPDSPVPKIGDRRRFSVIQKTSARTGNPYTKIKSEGEGYGQLYEITSVQKTDYGNHGNVSFNVSLSPAANGNGNATFPRMAGAPIIHNSASTKDETSRRMGRAHAQDMAIAYATLKGLKAIKPEDLRALIGWFEHDVDHGTAVEVKPEPSSGPEPAQSSNETGEDNGFDL